MTNKYLEKIAILDMVGGYYGAKKGDKVGGTLLGGTLGGGAGALAASPLLRTPVGLPALLAGAAGGGYLGGKAYSAIKSKIVGNKNKSNKTKK